MQPALLCPHLLVAGASIWGIFLLGVVFRHVICGFYLFSLPVRLPSEIRKLPPDLPVRGFPGVQKLPLLRLPSRDGSPSLTLLSLFLSFIFCPTSFQRGAAFLGAWCPLLVIRSCFVVCSVFKWSSDEFVGEKVVSPSCSSTILVPSLGPGSHEPPGREKSPPHWDPETEFVFPSKHNLYYVLNKQTFSTKIFLTSIFPFPINPVNNTAYQWLIHSDLNTKLLDKGTDTLYVAMSSSFLPTVPQQSSVCPMESDSSARGTKPMPPPSAPAPHPAEVGGWVGLLGLSQIPPRIQAQKSPEGWSVYGLKRSTEKSLDDRWGAEKNAHLFYPPLFSSPHLPVLDRTLIFRLSLLGILVLKAGTLASLQRPLSALTGCCQQPLKIKRESQRTHMPCAKLAASVTPTRVLAGWHWQINGRTNNSPRAIHLKEQRLKVFKGRRGWRKR